MYCWTNGILFMGSKTSIKIISVIIIQLFIFLWRIVIHLWGIVIYSVANRYVANRYCCEALYYWIQQQNTFVLCVLLIKNVERKFVLSAICEIIALLFLFLKKEMTQLKKLSIKMSERKQTTLGSAIFISTTFVY